MVIIYKKILLAIDESENSNRAIEKVISFQKNWNCKVVMFHSIKHFVRPILATISLPSTYGSYYISERDFEEAHELEGKKVLLSKEKLFYDAQVPIETRLIKDEKPEDYIERIVKEEHIDLVVIGAKGIHSKLKRILLGSVAQRVIKHASCDVLIVR